MATGNLGLPERSSINACRSSRQNERAGGKARPCMDRNDSQGRSETSVDLRWSPANDNAIERLWGSRLS